MNFYVRQRRDRLLVQLQLGVLLVGDVTYGSGEVEVAIYSSFHIDRGAGSVYSLALFLLVWLVVDGHGKGTPGLSQHAPGVTSVCAYQKIVL